MKRTFEPKNQLEEKCPMDYFLAETKNNLDEDNKFVARQLAIKFIEKLNFIVPIRMAPRKPLSKLIVPNDN